ncbi:hypothetical protein KIW84_014953 [Lathyrus oleraceus]|uniref:Uncharacterized protein n=1 Tax=Pisum sativum TaxID=3888 RepID=A0A9D5BP64_PEA|nr:hypothetical protein KIW84_014953 [Pisum sativum]
MRYRRSDQVEMAKAISTTISHSNKIKNIHSKLRIWERILLGYVNHRRPTNSPDYINIDHQYVLHFVAANKKVDLLGLLFWFLRDTVKESRNGSRKMNSWIPYGRLISDILMESKLIDSLADAENC